MKKEKKDAAGFQQLDAAQMKKINGGGHWVVVRDKDGNVIDKYWIP